MTIAPELTAAYRLVKTLHDVLGKDAEVPDELSDAIARYEWVEAARHRLLDGPAVTARVLDATPQGMSKVLSSLALQWAEDQTLALAFNGGGHRGLQAEAARRLYRAVAQATPYAANLMLPAAKEAAAVLTKVAPDLQGGLQVLDGTGPRTVAAKTLKSAQDAVAVLRKVAAVVPAHESLAVLVAIPATEMLLRQTVMHDPINSAEQLTLIWSVRRLAEEYRANPDLALTRVARGDYAGCTLAPTTSEGHLADREGNLTRALATRQPTSAEYRERGVAV